MASDPLVLMRLLEGTDVSDFVVVVEEGEIRKKTLRRRNRSTHTKNTNDSENKESPTELNTISLEMTS